MPRYATLGQIAFVFLLAFFTQMLVWDLVHAFSSHLGLILAEATLVLAAAFFITRTRRVAAEDALLLNATHFPLLGLVLPTATCAALLVGEFDLLWRAFLAHWEVSLPLSIQKTALELQIIRNPGELLPGFLAVAIAPALCEELFFRGFVFTGLYAHHGPRSAILGSAGLFALAHFNPWQFPAYFLLGLFLGLLVYWTHSIYPAVLAHAINNLISLVGVNLNVHWGVEALNSTHYLPLYISLLALPILFGGLRLMRRYCPIMPLPSPIPR